MGIQNPDGGLWREIVNMTTPKVVPPPLTPSRKVSRFPATLVKDVMVRY